MIWFGASPCASRSDQGCRERGRAHARRTFNQDFDWQSRAMPDVLMATEPKAL
uniref:Uncharacterized protein n=1 Tax=Ralstonia solanacearum TaxID=305 RepID=A0A0S4UEK7_RALSL|nr:protein of unknown function [Ralstonia solanacearum]